MDGSKMYKMFLAFPLSPFISERERKERGQLQFVHFVTLLEIFLMNDFIQCLKAFE